MAVVLGLSSKHPRRLLLIAVLAHNLLRWVAAIGLGARGELVVAKTPRRTLLRLPGRLTRSARRLVLHLPRCAAAQPRGSGGRSHD